jgi:predicted dehydrogenase
MENIYRAGIIGLGFIGAGDQVSGDALGQRVEDLDGTHLTAFLRNPRVDVVGGSSRDAGRRERFAERVAASVPDRRPVRAFESWRRMLDEEALDVVSIATYTPLHADIAVACAEAGVSVIYCEKPIAPTIDEAHRMLEACTKRGTLLVINHQRRFNPNLRRLRDLVADGAIGEVTSVTARWGSGRLGNVGTHVFDAVRMLTRLRAEAVSGTLDSAGRPDCRGVQFHDPGGWGVVRLEGGSRIMVDAADYAACPMSIELHGTLGSASVRGRNVSVERYGGAVERFPEITDGRTSMDHAVAEIVEWLDARRRSSGEAIPPFSCDAREAADVLETIVAFHASHRRSGAWVELPLTGDDRRITVEAG